MSPRTHILYYYEFVCIMHYVLYLHILYLLNYFFSFCFFAYFIFLICFCNTHFFCFFVLIWNLHEQHILMHFVLRHITWAVCELTNICCKFIHMHISFFCFCFFMFFFSHFLCCLLFAMCGIVTQLFYIIPVYIFYVGTNSQKHTSFWLIFNCNLKDTNKMIEYLFCL